MPKPRALVLTPDFPPEAGGIQILTHRVAQGLEAFETLVVAINDAGASEFDASSPLPTVRAGRPALSNKVNLAFLNAAGLRAARRFRPDIVLSIHIMCAPAAVAIRRLTGAPYVQYLHADEIPATPAIARFAMRHARAIVAVSRHTAQLAAEHGADPRKVAVINCGVDLPAQLRRTPASRPTILTIAGMEKRYKGHDVMLRALPLVRARVPDVQWVVVGGGALLGTYQQVAGHFGFDGLVRFLGRVSTEERDRWLDSAHVFAMPSRLRPNGTGGEGFGIVYLEAGAHGLPALGGNVGGALDAVVDGETGLLVDPRSHLDVADALTRLLSDRELAEAMGRAGRARAERMTWPIVASRVQDLMLAALR